MANTPLRVGTMIYGYCEGLFGRDSYGDRRVEAIGADWVVLRTEDNTVELYDGVPERLLEFSYPCASYHDDVREGCHVEHKHYAR